jgi:acyl transferase domain-containing protein/thioesterase domain-containing protein
MSPEALDDRHIAIIGMAGRFPGAPDLESFWRVIAEGRDTISRFEIDEGGAGMDGPSGGENYIRARGVLEGVEDFDAEFFDTTPEEAAHIDPQHRLWLEVAWEALEAAGYAHDQHKEIVSVYAGSFASTYLYNNLLRDRAAVEEFVRMRRAQSFALLVQNDPAFLPGRTAYKLNLRGPAINVQTACSTSLVAVAMAAQGLASFEADIAIAGGVCIAVPQRTGYFVQEGALHSRDGKCRPYDASACGTVFGNGAGAVVLKRLGDARRDRDPILAVIRGAAVNNDGRGKVSFSAPSVQGQAEVIATAHALASVEPGTIGYLEGHGTATPMGDPIEVEALRLAFQRAGTTHSCCLGSAKGNVGHLDAAAGVTGLIRAVLSLQHRQLPATAHFERPNPELRLEGSPFFVNRETTPWPESDHPRRAAVSSFGIGGTNAHVVLEEWRGKGEAGGLRSEESTTLLLSARNRTALDEYTKRLASWMEGAPSVEARSRPLTSVAAALRDRRKLFPHRRAIRVTGWADAQAALRDPERWDTGTAIDGGPRLIFSFPGQGSLKPGAMAQLLREEPDLRRHLETLARPASEMVGFDLLAWAEDPGADAEPLRRDNAKAQLAIFCIDAALARWLEAHGVRAGGFVGHSLGEWVGAHLAGVLSAEDAVWAVHRRGRLMQETGPGAALAVRLSESAVSPYIQDGVSLACVNGPQLCLLSGRRDAIERCAKRLASDGVKVRPLPIDVAVHSPHMDPVVEGLRRDLATLGWHTPDRALLSPVTGTWLSQSEAISVEYWANQPRRPVRFNDAVSTLLEEARCVVLEVGIGNALTSLVKVRLRDPRRHQGLSLLDPPLEGAGTSGWRLRRCLNDLWACGVDVDLLGEIDGGAEAPVLPTYAFQRRHCWKDAPETCPPSSRAENAAGDEMQRVAAAKGDAREQLIRIIQAMSGIARESLDPTVPFSSLGLDSLFLVQLTEELTSHFAVPVSFAQLAQHNTIDALAASLPQQQASPPLEQVPHATRTPTATTFRGLFPLRQGDGVLPLLLVHGDVGNDLLPPTLPPEQSIYGYSHQGSGGDRVVLRTVESLARRCHDEWIAVSNGAPCIVAGHSYGGLVAHQVAHLLRQGGLPVELLVLIDTAHPRTLHNPFPGGPKRLGRSIRMAFDRSGFALDIARARLALATVGRVAVPDRTRYLMAEYELAVRLHTPPVLDVNTLLFRARDGSDELPNRGWVASDFRTLAVVDVPGSHLSIVRNRVAFGPIAEAIGLQVRELRAQALSSCSSCMNKG